MILYTNIKILCCLDCQSVCGREGVPAQVGCPNSAVLTSFHARSACIKCNAKVISSIVPVASSRWHLALHDLVTYHIAFSPVLLREREARPKQVTDAAEACAALTCAILSTCGLVCWILIHVSCIGYSMKQIMMACRACRKEHCQIGGPAVSIFCNRHD